MDDNDEMLVEEAAVRYDELMGTFGDRERALSELEGEYPNLSRDLLERRTFLDPEDD